MLTAAAASFVLTVGGIITAQIFDSHTPVQLGEALAVAAVVVPGTFWIGGFMRGLRAELGVVGNKLNALEGVKADVAALKVDVAGLKVQMDMMREEFGSLPCKSGGEIPDFCPGSHDPRETESIARSNHELLKQIQPILERILSGKK